MCIGAKPLDPFQEPHHHALDDEGEHAQAQDEEQDQGAETARLGLLRQVPDDEAHEADQHGDEDDHHPFFEYCRIHRCSPGRLSARSYTGRRGGQRRWVRGSSVLARTWLRTKLERTLVTPSMRVRLPSS